MNDEQLQNEHTPTAIRERIEASTSHSYLGDMVLGAVDGTVTTFAVVAGVAGAGLNEFVALALGLANLVADGFSMAVGNYLNVKSDRQVVDRVRDMEEMHIREIPEGERDEIREIFAAKGFEGQLLDEIVDVITSDRRRWVDTMVTDEFGLPLETPSPQIAGVTTFAAFIVAGAVPLAPYCLPLGLSENNIFAASAIATAVTFAIIGVIKGHVVNRSKWLSGLETLLVGGAAATLAYLVGHWVRELAG